MANKLQKIQLGAPPFIEGNGDSPDAELSVQSGMNLNSITLKDESGSCTKNGAVKTFLMLLDKVKRVQEYIDFEDEEVKKVLFSHDVGDKWGITKEDMASVSNIFSWFQDNTDIRYFDELQFTNVVDIGYNNSDAKVYGFGGCSNLEYVNLSKVKTIVGNTASNNTFAGCSKLKSVNVLANLVSIGNQSFLKSNAPAPLFMPSVESATDVAFNSSLAPIFDFGNKLKKAWNPFANNGANRFYVVFRGNIPSELSFERGADRTPKATFVYSQYKDEYETAIHSFLPSALVYVIGGEEWQTAMRQLADQYAAEYAGWTNAQIANADYSRAYIDYDIFGVDKSKAPYVLFDDPEVERVLLANATHADENVITHEETKQEIPYNVTWFKNNANIKSFYELCLFENISISISGKKKYGILPSFEGCSNLERLNTSNIKVAYVYNCLTGCTNLKGCDFSNLTDVTSSIAAEQVDVFKTLVFKNLINGGTSDATILKSGVRIDKFIVLPLIKKGFLNGSSWTYTKGCDCGYNQITSPIPEVYAGTMEYYIMRARIKVIHTNDRWSSYRPNNIFVPSELVDEYKNDQEWSRAKDVFFAIGGEKWVECFGSADKYANLTAEEAAVYHELFPQYD